MLKGRLGNRCLIWGLAPLNVDSNLCYLSSDNSYNLPSRPICPDIDRIFFHRTDTSHPHIRPYCALRVPIHNPNPYVRTFICSPPEEQRSLRTEEQSITGELRIKVEERHALCLGIMGLVADRSTIGELGFVGSHVKVGTYLNQRCLRTLLICCGAKRLQAGVRDRPTYLDLDITGLAPAESVRPSQFNPTLQNFR